MPAARWFERGLSIEALTDEVEKARKLYRAATGRDMPAVMRLSEPTQLPTPAKRRSSTNFISGLVSGRGEGSRAAKANQAPTAVRI